MAYPDLLTSISGEKITTKEQWEKFRREECMTLLSNYAYGYPPVKIPENLKFETEVLNSDLQGLVVKKMTILFKEYSFPVTIFYKPSDKPLPTILYYMHFKAMQITDIEQEPNTENIPIKDIVEKGYAVIVLKFPDVYNDNLWDTDYESSLFKPFSLPREQRDDNEWASISLWAWCSSRIMDYVETDAVFDKDNVAVVGHSRGGKTALWTGAIDPRFSFVVSNSSGCLGAAMLRGKTGEHLDFITSHTDWLCKNLNRFVNNEEMLPFDQHMLLACIAPRSLYVESNSEDEWSDPTAERLGARLASKVYELYGKKGVVLPDEPDVEIDKAYHDGTIGYHVSEGKHKIRAHDWEKFLTFWEKERGL